MNVKEILDAFVMKNFSKLNLTKVPPIKSGIENATAYIVLFSRKFQIFGEKKLPIELWCDVANEDKIPRYSFSLEVTNADKKCILEHLPDLMDITDPDKWKDDKWNEKDSFEIHKEHYQQLIFEAADVRLKDWMQYDESVVIDVEKVKDALLNSSDDVEKYITYYFEEDCFDDAVRDFFGEIIPCLQRDESTERLAEVLLRRGQNVYRQMQMTYWNGKCAVTGCNVNEALRASHAKPWRDCKQAEERLNFYNGFLLSANLDALFDKGLITFDDDGKIVLSSCLKEQEARRIGIYADMKLRWIDEKHKPFLKYHREHIWKGI